MFWPPDLDRLFGAVADSVNKLVLQVQSWNLNQKIERQQQRHLIQSMSFGVLCQNAHDLGTQIGSAYA